MSLSNQTLFCTPLADTHEDSTVTCFDSEDDAIDEDECETETIFKVFRDVLEIFEKESIKSEFLSFLKLVSAEKFPLDKCLI